MFTNSSIENLNINKANSRASEKRLGFTSEQSFNFASNHIIGRDGYGNLKVFNDDLVDDGIGIPMHPHSNFEILSVILTGNMEHKDNLGNRFMLNKNDVKLMSSGGGLIHGGTCFNRTNFLQIWVAPNQLNTNPSVTIKYFSENDRINKWQIQVSPDSNDNVLKIKQNIRAYRGTFKEDKEVNFIQKGNQRIFLIPLNGSIMLNDVVVEHRDSAEFTTNDGFSFTPITDCDIWLMAETI